MTHNDTSVPPPGSRWDNDRGKHNWKNAAYLLSQSPGEWLLVARDVASGTAQNVRRGRIIPIRDLGGTVEAAMRGSTRRGTTRYGDLYVRWTPDESEEKADE